MYILSLFEYDESLTHNFWNFPNTTLNFNKVYYVIDGEGHYKDNDQDIIFKKNHLYVLPAKKPYSLWDNTENKLNHLYMHIYTTPVIDKFIEVNLENDEFVKDIVVLLRKNAKKSKNNKKLLSLLEVALNHILENDTTSNTLPFLIKDYISKNVYTELNMLDMSKYFGYSTSHLVKCFKTAFNVTPKQYHEMLQFDYIINEFKNGIPCYKVTEMFGYSSPSNLSRDFKKRFGLSPQKYIKHYINK